jgi:hypothetical protein
VTEIRILPAAPDHAVAMAPHLRPADAAEIHAASGRTAEQALLTSLALSTHAWTAVIDGRPACIWGAGPLSLVLGRGCPWLLGTSEVERQARPFLRLSRAFLAEMRATYPELENHVDARNRTSLRWLRWLGFTIAPAAPWGFLGLPFHRFRMGWEDV